MRILLQSDLKALGNQLTTDKIKQVSMLELPPYEVQQKSFPNKTSNQRITLILIYNIDDGQVLFKQKSSLGLFYSFYFFFLWLSYLRLLLKGKR
jgi:hypothetical protein